MTAKRKYDGNIYKLRLHEFVSSTCTNHIITRVPGGWLYSSYHSAGDQVVQTFVPYHVNALVNEQKSPTEAEL